MDTSSDDGKKDKTGEDPDFNFKLFAVLVIFDEINGGLS